MQTWRAATGSGADPARSVTVQRLSLSSHSMNAPVASGREASMASAEMLRAPYGCGTGRAITAGWFVVASRNGESGTYSACSVNASPVMIGSNAALTAA